MIIHASEYGRSSGRSIAANAVASGGMRLRIGSTSTSSDTRNDSPLKASTSGVFSC